MKRFALSFGVFLFVVAFPVAISSQSPQSSDAVPLGVTGEGRVAESMSGEHIPAVSGLPFSAKVVLETVSHLQDGTLITHTTYNLDARDSSGRTRNEMRNWISSDGAEPRLTRVELYDPATRTRTDLYPLSKLARQWILGAATQTAAPVTPGPKPEVTREEIGTDTMEGLPVKGLRVTQTYATGALGNDRPLSVVTETWYSPELHINLLTKKSDPRYGEQTVRVTELDRQEPDAALFAIGAEYKIVNETAPVLSAQSSGGADERAASGGAADLSPALAGIARAGRNGVTVPECVYCPAPSYTDEARRAKISGGVVLQVVVNAEGHAENITVMKKLGYGLDQSAIETVKRWKFQPAKSPGGNPVATVVPIEMTFRLN
jgi:TonB family protein